MFDISILVWLGVSALATWQVAEILHHSQAGYPWRALAAKLSSFKYTRLLGDGASCVFCFSNWIGIGVVGLGAFHWLNTRTALLYTFIGGLAAARLANLCNDYFHYVCRTPDTNENSKSAQMTNSWGDDLETSVSPDDAF